MPKVARTKPSSRPDEGESQEKRVIQIEFKTALQQLGVRAKSPSSFRFTREDGRHITELHKIAREHKMHSAYRAIHLRYPGKTRRRQKGEKANLSRFVHLHFPAYADVAKVLRKLRTLPEVANAAEYHEFTAPSAGNPMLAVPVFPTDPLLGTRDQLDTDPITNLDRQWYIFRCKIDNAWKRVSGAGVVIADVDFGFFLKHEDLANRVERTHNTWDGTLNASAGATDHGTGVLGLLGAKSNKVGIAGVAFGSALWAVQYNTGTGQKLPGNALASAIDWATQQDSAGRRVVINVEAQSPDVLSLDPHPGNCEQDPAVAAAIQNAIKKGCVVCVAAGNGGRDAGIADDRRTEILPTGSILVGATAFDPVDNPRAIAPGKASNFGNRVVVSAPGDARHDITCRDLTPSDYTNQFGGTSGAVAKVAGVIALMLEANPTLTHEDVRRILTTTGSPLNNDHPMGVFLNADAALSAAIQSMKA